MIGLIYATQFNARKGPFNLRIFSRPVALIGVCWIIFITIIFCLPTANPVTSQTLNYTVVAVGIIAIFANGVWLLTARKWFVGPRREVEEVEAMGGGVNLFEPGAIEAVEEKMAARTESTTKTE